MARGKKSLFGPRNNLTNEKPLFYNRSMKTKQVKPKSVRAVRLSDTMWKRVQDEAAKKEMRPSEFMRRLIEAHFADADEAR
jgi:hypothetical protein